MADVKPKVYQDLDRGARAEKLLNDPLLVESFQTLRETILSGIEATPLRDVEGAEKLRIMLKLLKDLRHNIDKVVQDGKLAKVEIERNSKLSFFKR